MVILLTAYLMLFNQCMEEGIWKWQQLLLLLPSPPLAKRKESDTVVILFQHALSKLGEEQTLSGVPSWRVADRGLIGLLSLKGYHTPRSFKVTS